MSLSSKQGPPGEGKEAGARLRRVWLTAALRKKSYTFVPRTWLGPTPCHQSNYFLNQGPRVLQREASPVPASTRALTQPCSAPGKRALGEPQCHNASPPPNRPHLSSLPPPFSSGRYHPPCQASPGSPPCCLSHARALISLEGGTHRIP